MGIGLLVAWNALGFWSIRLNGGTGRIEKPLTLAVAALVCGFVSVFFLAAVVSRAFRELITAESRRHLYTTSAWGVLAAVPGLLCLIAVVALLGWFPLAGLDR